MKSVKRKRIVQFIKTSSPWLIYAFLLIVPLLFLAVQSLVDMSSAEESVFQNWISVRSMNLLFDSILLACLVSVFAMLISLLFGLLVYSRWSGFIREMKWILLFFAVIPPYVQASVWLDVFSLFGWPTQGLLISFWVQLLSLLPLSLLMVIYGYQQVQTDVIEAGRLLSSDQLVLRKIILPAVKPFVITSGGVLFVFSLLDYTIPTIFQYPVYSLEILEEFAATGQVLYPFLKSIILMLIIVPVLVGSAYWFINMNAKPLQSNLSAGVKLKFSLLVKFGLSLLCLLLILVFLIPIFDLFFRSGSLIEVPTALQDNMRILIHSVHMAFWSSFAMIVLAYWLLSTIRSLNLFAWLIILLPLCVPQALSGLSLSVFWNQSFFHQVYGSNLMLILVNIIRFGPIAVLILYLFKSRISENLVEAGKVYQANRFRRFRQLDLPLHLPGIITAFLLLFILSLGEVGASIAVIPPGGETLSIRIFNYLHYGAGEVVSGISLSVFALLLLGYFLHLLYRKTKGTRSTQGSSSIKTTES